MFTFEGLTWLLYLIGKILDLGGLTRFSEFNGIMFFLGVLNWIIFTLGGFMIFIGIIFCWGWAIWLIFIIFCLGAVIIFIGVILVFGGLTWIIFWFWFLIGLYAIILLLILLLIFWAIMGIFCWIIFGPGLGLAIGKGEGRKGVGVGYLFATVNEGGIWCIILLFWLGGK